MLEDPVCKTRLVQFAQAADMAGKTDAALDAAERSRLLSPGCSIERCLLGTMALEGSGRGK
jgi:hypothetical protein